MNNQMKRTVWIVVILIATLFVLSSCSSGTKLISAGKEPEYSGGYIDSIMIVGVSDNFEDRRLFENTFSKCLKGQGVTAYSSLEFISVDQELSKELVKKVAEENGIGSVLVTRLVGVDKKVDHYRSGFRKKGAVSIYHSFDDLNPKVKRDAKSGYYIERKIVRLESNLYDVSSEKQIWTAQSDSIASESVKNLTKSVCQAMVKNMRKNNLIR